ncbi:histone H3.3-like [Coccinella septempunctata]|uniref:histone H3.3-like n=1 Tax=Coccinella septempunctata TaxID=41139 RepID=UPI001D064454|nr:histone H3.3-like [Coccinella septempunctata]
MVRVKQINGKQKLEDTIQEKILKAKKDKYESKTSVDKSKKLYRKRGNFVLDEIRHYQLVTENLILKKPFQRLVKEILINVQAENARPLYRMSCAAVCILQDMAESYLTDLMNDGVICALHANRITIFPKDFDLVLRLSPNY